MLKWAWLSLFLLPWQFQQTITNDVPFSTAITANFNGRSGGTTIPANMLGSNVSGIYGSSPHDGTTGSDLNALGAAGLHHVRLFIDLGTCAVGASCSWSTPNAQITDLVQADANVKVLVTVVDVPQDNESVASSTCSPPSSNTNYASTINAFLAQANAAVDSVEIGNEADIGGHWCPSGGSANYLSTYKTMIAAVGPAVKTAHSSLLIGAAPLGSTADITAWLGSGGILASWSSPDFVSYHLYEAATYTTWASVLSDMQATTGGIGYWFKQVQSTLSGQSYSGQIWVTEGADSYSSASADCCRFDSTYSPMWHVLNPINYLNAVLTSGATALPNRFYIYTNENNIANGWCLTGDTALDCKNGTTPITPMPPYYSYALLNDLNLPAGGNVATSVSPASTTSGVSCAAFYTSSGGDVIVCVNPTTTGYGQAKFTFTSAGSLTGTATAYRLDSANSTVTQTTVSAVQSGTTYSCVVGMPALSTVAIKIT